MKRVYTILIVGTICFVGIFLIVVSGHKKEIHCSWLVTIAMLTVSFATFLIVLYGFFQRECLLRSKELEEEAKKDEFNRKKEYLFLERKIDAVEKKEGELTQREKQIEEAKGSISPESKACIEKQIEQKIGASKFALFLSLRADKPSMTFEEIKEKIQKIDGEYNDVINYINK